MPQRPIKVYQVRRSVAIIILVFQFTCIAMLVAGYADLRGLQRFDSRRAFDVCVGANVQIKKVVDRLTAPAPIPDNATETERMTLELRNQRSEASRVDLDQVIQESLEMCATDFPIEGKKG